MAESDDKTLSISELTGRIKSAIRSGVATCWVEGEISGYRGSANSSGHLYFSLTDGKSTIAAAVFFANTSGVIAPGLELCDGKLVRAYGEVSVYEVRGTYTFIIRKLEAAGVGDILARLEELKKRLVAEGIFDVERKRPLPFLPRHIGVISSPTGAVIHDILKVSLRRFPNIHLTLAPVAVQGARAAEMVTKALGYFNNVAPESGQEAVDLIIIARGGGSFEDLMPFNDEKLVRAVADSKIPVISSIGHQTDVTLCDLAASVRAATPSEAAEKAVPDRNALLAMVAKLERSMLSCITGQLATCEARLVAVRNCSFFKQPGRLTETLAMRVDAAETALGSLRRECIGEIAAKIERLVEAMQRGIASKIELAQRQCRDLERDLERGVKLSAERKTRDFEKVRAKLEAYDPLSALRRGYTITFDGKGSVVRGAEEAQRAEMLVTKFFDGTVQSAVLRKKRETED